MKKKKIIILIALVTSLLTILFIYKRFFEKNIFYEEVMVENVNYSTSYVKMNDKSLEIYSNLIDKNKKIIIEGTNQGNKYSINKIHLNFNSKEEKELFAINKLYNNSFVKSYSIYLEPITENSIFVIIPLKIEGQEYVYILSPLETYNFITKHYSPPINYGNNDIILKKKKESNVIKVNYYESGNVKEVKFNQKEEEISFENLGKGFYSIKLEVAQNLLEFILF